MPLSTPALLVHSAGQAFARGTVQRRDVGPSDVLIDIAFAGICHSDIHQAREEWGRAIFPMVPGHEIAGIVREVGSGVTKYAVGDRVGIGCFVDSCRECENCLAGEEQFCLRGNVATYNGRAYDGTDTYGGYSTQIVADESYVLRIPEGIPLDAAAPLLCAGITTYSPLRHWGAGPGKRVAVIGMGGLGHMGVQIAHAMGAHVTVLSRTLAKEAEGRALGADAYHATEDATTFASLRNRFDLIINTVSADIPVDRYLSTLRLDGALVFVGLPENPQTFRVFSLTGARRSIAGSNIGGIRETQEMLDFCAEHGIASVIETIGADEVTDAYDRVVRGDVRYRFVIDTATIPEAA
ncbi:NAD(P)-dependent alcohol dehydrogenase [Microbacterium sp.]|uniref:NAD(P)-dependent alcohol dehydrogenase n=1 Tax=Microbacterium sp. TaxID=51671 RepID=UPI002E2EE30B|nr:NAD(P)-dependent alcohol dehydrogenase [Microbacterium sp.]HEX5728044.1 NAD(P)-dependent alcohol dehydrogenase [Microbacterium sp.]